MQTKLLYLYDSYLREFEAEVVKIEENKVILNQTAFHPLTGGVANDTGYLLKDNEKYRVIDVKLNKETGEVIHIIDGEVKLKPGDKVKGVIDWDRRYRLMKLHTAAHLIAAVLYRDYNALITGGHVDVEKAKEDFNLEKPDRRIFEDAVRKANEAVKNKLPVKIYFLTREEAMKIPGIVKLAERMPPEVKKLRIVEIEGVDIQADGGPHVKNTEEIGEIKLLKIENKGRTKRRIYFTI
ncbi:MAG: alanyl-tRNA editing protein AlaXM [archaeon GB-1867-035]|mgnify:FL=1|nr:alanyl-tRNA editing protein AlaXM [Candidatus Culexmicrobium profundum]